MPIERRLKALEAQIPLRCPTCKSALQCHVCSDWKDEARSYGLDPEQLVARMQREMEAALAGRPHDVFLSHGYDLAKLRAEEVKLLRALLDKAGGTANVEAPH